MTRTGEDVKDDDERSDVRPEILRGRGPGTTHDPGRRYGRERFTTHVVLWETSTVSEENPVLPVAQPPNFTTLYLRGNRVVRVGFVTKVRSGRTARSGVYR